MSLSKTLYLLPNTGSIQEMSHYDCKIVDWDEKNKLITKHYACLSYDFASGSEITPCNKIDKPLVVYRF